MLLSLSLPVSIGWRLCTENADLRGQLIYPYWLPAFLFCFAAGALVALLAEAQRAGIVHLRRLGTFVRGPVGARGARRRVGRSSSPHRSAVRPGSCR